MDLRVVVAVPSHGEWKTGFGMSVTKAMQAFDKTDYEGGKKEIFIASCQGTILTDVRHTLVIEAARAEATHMIWCDADMEFPPDAFIRLMQHGKAVVGANYPRRKMPCIPTAYAYDEDGKGRKVFTEEHSTGLERVSHMGFGLLAVRMDVYDLIDLPYFAFEPMPNGYQCIGEDVYFARKLKEAGVPMWCDHDLSKEVGHIGELIYTHQMALACRDEELRGA